jgi:serine/threonine protein kinase
MDIVSSKCLIQAVRLIAEPPNSSDSVEPLKHRNTLGIGSSALVKQGLLTPTDRVRTAYKISKQLFPPSTPRSFNANRFQQFFREASILLDPFLQNHGNVITLLRLKWATMSHEPFTFAPALQLEEAPLGDLNAFLETEMDLDWSHRKFLCADVAAGVEALHLRGIVHGNLTTTNILIFNHPTRRFIAKVAGLGNACIMRAEDPTDVRLPVFNPTWSAPEAEEPVAMKQLSKVDVFSLGLVIWQLLAKGNPFKVFDTPLDEALRSQTLRKILRLPYLFRLIPMYLEHYVQYIPADELVFLTTLFSYTVRVSPRQRNLAKVVDLLTPYMAEDLPR